LTICANYEDLPPVLPGVFAVLQLHLALIGEALAFAGAVPGADWLVVLRAAVGTVVNVIVTGQVRLDSFEAHHTKHHQASWKNCKISI
jgi:hypothetical protein